METGGLRSPRLGVMLRTKLGCSGLLGSVCSLCCLGSSYSYLVMRVYVAFPWLLVIILSLVKLMSIYQLSSSCSVPVLGVEVLLW